jgi:23S rRNA (uracil1939-C5)-methyltransferase
VDEIELVVEKLVSGGEGIGWYRGVPIFVPRSAPGDRLRVRIVERRPHYGRAEIMKILSPGEGRRIPPCPHFESCGACDLQHLSEEVQLKWKVAATKETLTRIGNLRLPEAQRIVQGKTWGYRLRTQLHVESRKAVEIGYFERRSHRLVSIESCPVLMPALESFVLSLRHRLRGEVPRRLDVASGDAGTITCSPPVGSLPRGEVAVTVEGDTLAFDARTFFQAHRELLPQLVDSVVGKWSGESAYDLYSGVGLFALPLSKKYRRVVAVDGDRVAGRYAKKNGRQGRVRNLDVVSAAVESWVKSLPVGADRVVVDPPRAGLLAEVREILAERRPSRLTYVSCHPAALARDLGALARTYEIEELTFVDLFPQTAHIEVVAQLRYQR